MLFPIYGIVALGLILSAGYFLKAYYSRAPLPKAQLEIKDHTLNVEIADNIATRMKGLSGRDGLAENSGLYFSFPLRARHGFWMKDMKFGIDMIWVDGHTVRGVTENVQPEPGKSMLQLTVYYPPSEINKVLEVPAGTAARLGITAGDQIKLSFPQSTK